MQANGETTSLCGQRVRLIYADGTVSSPLLVLSEHRCAAALGKGMKHLPALELRRDDGQIIWTYRRDVIPATPQALLRFCRWAQGD